MKTLFILLMLLLPITALGGNLKNICDMEVNPNWISVEQWGRDLMIVDIPKPIRFAGKQLTESIVIITPDHTPIWIGGLISSKDNHIVRVHQRLTRKYGESSEIGLIRYEWHNTHYQLVAFLDLYQEGWGVFIRCE